MQRTAYDKRSFRRLERKQCAVSLLLGEAAGDCRGSIHRHHTDPEDESSRTVEVCNAHHQHLHHLLRTLDEAREPDWKKCPHPPGTHRYPGAREACERRLNLKPPT